MANSANQQQTTIPLHQKLGLRFYASHLTQALILWLIFYVQNGLIALFTIGVYNSIGNYLPIKAVNQTKFAKTQNNNKWLLGPLISSCISTPLIFYIVWSNYDVIHNSSFGMNFCNLISIAFIAAGSIDASHELLHRTQPIAHFFSYLNLFFLQFTIYPTQHLYLHHKKVGTPDDAITAPKNQNLYHYYVNALFKCYKFNYGYSKKIFAFNVISTISANLFFILLALKEGSGISKALFFTAITYTSLFVMEAIEFIEHYGLVYRADEREKTVTEVCAWNSQRNQMLDWFVFKFQKHSDHHMNAYKIYASMQINQKMPHFPFDFISGLVMSVIPPLWSKIMNPLADQVIEGKPATKEHHQFVKNVFRGYHFLTYGLLAFSIAAHLSM